MHCPSCRAEIDADKKFAHMVVCHYCKSTIILDEKAASLAGKMAVLPQSLSPLYVGGSGRVYDHRFRVLGRVRYGYEQGYWDEWYLSLDDGTTAWVSEDERKLTLERLKVEETPKILYEDTNPGDHVTLGKKTLHVDERGEATCEGAEGQLPFPVVLGEKTPFLDLSDGRNFATIEYDDDGSARIYYGRRVKGKSLRMDMTAQEAGVAVGGTLPTERAADESTRERVTKQSGREKTIKCFACSAPLEIPAQGVDSIACDHCGAHLDLTLRRIECEGCGATVPVHGGASAHSVVCSHCQTHLKLSPDDESSILANLAGHKRPKLPFSLGDKCRFDAVDYVFVGHVRYREMQDIVYITDEFLLHNPEKGYRWLTRYLGHYSLSLDLGDRPRTINPRTSTRRTGFPFLDRRWKVFESNFGGYEVAWVDGELPWVATVGDRSSYMDAISPPYMLSAEWTAAEMEWSLSKYIDPKEVADAFGLDPGKFRPPLGVAPNQPYPAGPFRRESAWVMSGFAMLCLFLMVCFWPAGRHVSSFSVQPDDYANEYITDSFEVTRPYSLCEIEFDAPVDNSWIYLDLAVINAEDQAIIETSAEISYYHGYEGGESWSEGSRSTSKVFKLHEPGEYRLLMVGQAGTGESNQGTRTYGKPIQIAVYEGVVLSRYFASASLLGICWAAFEWLRRAHFETKRWGDEDDDDD